jgi:arsenate reductase (thioredoxin)
MEKIKVLFLCIHNSARSQMAEAYLKHFGGDKFHVESAGLEAGKLNPFAVEVMQEEGIDISKNETNDVFDFYNDGRTYNYVITVCDAGNSDKCPLFPGINKKINWNFTDPSSLTGTHEDKLNTTREVRNKIKDAVLNFIKQTETK